MKYKCCTTNALFGAYGRSREIVMLLHVSFFTFLFLIFSEDFLSSCFCTSVFPLKTFAYQKNT